MRTSTIYRLLQPIEGFPYMITDAYVNFAIAHGATEEDLKKIEEQTKFTLPASFFPTDPIVLKFDILKDNKPVGVLFITDFPHLKPPEEGDDNWRDSSIERLLSFDSPLYYLVHYLLEATQTELYHAEMKFAGFKSPQSTLSNIIQVNHMENSKIPVVTIPFNPKLLQMNNLRT